MKKEMEWSPQDALKAYLQTLHLSTTNSKQNQEESLSVDSNKTQQQETNNLTESQGSELISAMAAGNQAKVLLEITTSKQGITPFTIALAVAAKQTGGKLTCIIPHHNGYNHTLRKIKNELSLHGIDTIINHDDHARDRDNAGVVELRVGDPYENINDLTNIDIAVIDCKFNESSSLRSLCRRLDLNPKGAIIVANNVGHRTQSVALVDEILKGKRGVESSVTALPMGCGGIQVIIRIKAGMMHSDKPPQRRKQKRFLVTFDD